MAPSDYEFRFFMDKQNKWRWYLWNHKNRTKIATSGENFSSIESCARNAKLVKLVAGSAAISYA